MKRKVITNDGEIEYYVKVSKRARLLRLVVNREGIINVTIPYRVSEKRADDFVVQKSKWIVDKVERCKQNPKTTVQHTKEEIDTYKKKARDIVVERLEYWNILYRFTYKKITIKNVTSRWGSCSKVGNLNFSYKLALIPQELVDYIVVHELCHLGEMNHSVRFWNLVSKTIPHHKVLRKQLKQYY